MSGISDGPGGEAERAPAWKQAVGYLQGRGGAATLTGDDARAEWRAVFAQLRAELDALEAECVQAEDAMEAVGEALMRSQPPMWKRVAVRWWRLTGGARRTPVLVRVEAGAGGRVKLVPFEPGMKLRKDRSFGLCADLAKVAVDRYWALASMRKEQVALVAEVSRVLGRGAKRRRGALADALERMAVVRAEAEERLRMVGYEVPVAEGVMAEGEGEGEPG